MKLYISGPITGTEDYMKRFEETEQEYQALGYEVINPAKLNALLPESTTHEQYMSMCYPMIDMCDTILLMHGWQQSKGAVMEFGYAIGKGLNIIDQDGLAYRASEAAEEMVKPIMKFFEALDSVCMQAADKEE
jgi:nucleoside 2-deoxyribosyltransferase